MTWPMNGLVMVLPSGDGEGQRIPTKCIHIFFERVVLFGPVNEIVRDLVSQGSAATVFHFESFQAPYIRLFHLTLDLLISKTLGYRWEGSRTSNLSSIC